MGEEKTTEEIALETATEEQKAEINQTKEEVGKYKALETLKNSEGGQVLISALQEAVISHISTLISKYRLAETTDIELRAIIASVEAKLNTIRVLKNAESNRETFEEQLNELISKL